MREILDLSKINWITDSLLPEPQDKEWRDRKYKFGHVIPQGFGSYCKILHSLYVDLDIKDETRTWNDVKIDVDNSEYKSLMARDVVYKINFNGRRIRLAQLAAQNNIPFTHQVLDSLYRGQWPVRLVGTTEGEMDSETAHHLARVFSQFTNDNKYYFGYPDWEKGLRILEGDLTDGLVTIDAKKYVPGNTLYWWATDKSWCVAVYGDSESSLCGASPDLINALLADQNLECFKIDVNEKFS